jgi:hypothetical protein
MREVRLRPDMQQGVDVRASADAFGGGVARGMQSMGQGMQSIGQGLGQAAEAVSQLNDFKARLEATDAQTARDREILDLQYGPNGYLTTQGADAANGYQGYTAKIEEINKKFAASLKGPAARYYNDAVTASTTSEMRTGIVHSAQGTKEWAQASHNAAMAQREAEAVANFNNPKKVDEIVARGFMLLDNQADLVGLSGNADVINQNRTAFATKVYSQVTLAMASQPGGATKAIEYLNSKSDLIDPASRMKLEAELKPFAIEEEALGHVTEILGMTRDTGAGAAEGTVGAAGPTAVRQRLYGRAAAAGKGRDHVDGLNEGFATNLLAMFEDAPFPGLQIGSGYRSEERQAEIIAENMAAYGLGGRIAEWNADVAAMGPVAAGQKWRSTFQGVRNSAGRRFTEMVGMPGASNHQHGNAVDIWYNGVRLDKAPAEVRQWVHDNAGAYGLRFPMSWESWHIEPAGARGGGAGSTAVPAMDGVSYRASAVSFEAAMARVNEIQDPEVRAAAMKQVTAEFEMRGKAEAARAREARASGFAMVEQGMSVDQIPLEMRITMGQEAVQGLRSYENQMGDPTTDPLLLARLTIQAKADPVGFAREVQETGMLTSPEVINNLSKSDYKSVVDMYSSVLADERKASEEGTIFKRAYEVGAEFYGSAGIKTGTGVAAQTEDNIRLKAQFDQAMMLEVQQWQQNNQGKRPGYEDLRMLAAGLVMDAIAQQKRESSFLSFFGEDGMNQVWSGKMFQRLDAPGGSEITAVPVFENIPADWVSAITIALTQRGVEPTKEAIAIEWAKVVDEMVGGN